MNEQPVSAIYPSIYHYTGDKGLDGILRSKSLWATHYKFLNDTKELKVFIQAFKSRLDFTAPISEEKFKLHLDVLEKSLDSLIDYFDAHSPHYLTCFCPEDAFGSQNGRLSQWIRYGKDEGYAIEFDSAKLEEMLKIESKTGKGLAYSVGVGFKSVAYYNNVTSEICRHGFNLSNKEEEDNKRTVGATKGKLKELFDLLNTPPPTGKELNGHIQKCMESLSYSATRIKHYGFHEECEIRIVAPAWVQEKLNGIQADLTAKPIYFRDNDKAPYIVLFEGKDCDDLFQKSIKGIIIGPGAHQERRRVKVEMFLKKYGYPAEKINIRCSNIPFSN